MKGKRKWLRMWKILAFALTVLIRVYWYRILKKPESERERLWGTIGKQFRQLLFELEGLLIKVGQFLSIRADLLPRSFVNQIQDLVDQVPASNWEEIKRQLEREWDEPIEERLLSMDSKAVASASIGEVYRGQLKDGTEVAVKVQRPTIKPIIQTDFRSLAMIIWFVHHFVPMPKGFINFKFLFKELKTVIERELDYEKERNTIDLFRQRFQSVPQVVIPKVYPEFCTSKVLVMEWVDGVRITDVDFLEQSHINKAELSRRLFQIFIPQWLEAGVFHADPHAGNVLVKADGTIVLIDFGMVGEITKNDAASFQEFLLAVFLKNYSKAAEVLIDLGFLLPEVNLKTIAVLLKEAFSFDLNQLKEGDLFKIKKDFNEIVQTLPIQVPTRFIFLGRSFATVEGLLQSIHPNQDFMEIAKPVFIEWLKQNNESKWRLVLKWINAQPIFQIVHSVADLLEAPQKFMALKETQQQRAFYFSLYENQKKQAFFLGVLGLVGVFFGSYTAYSFILQVSASLVGVTVIYYVVSSVKQRKWLKSMKNRIG